MLELELEEHGVVLMYSWLPKPPSLFFEYMVVEATSVMMTKKSG